MSKQILRNASYSLGTIINGTVYIYTALGQFKTAAAAVARCNEKRAIVFVQYDVYARRGGAPYGLTSYEPVAVLV